jgi:hypothetical protein
MDVSDSFHVPSHFTPRDGRLGGPQNRFGSVAKKKSPHWNRTLVVHPVTILTELPMEISDYSYNKL